MSVSLECKKAKRTGFLPAFFGGGILAAVVPVINMAVRSERYLNLPENPIHDDNAECAACSSRSLSAISYGICRQRYAENEVAAHSGKFHFLRQSNFNNFYEPFCARNRSGSSRFLYLSLVCNRKWFFR